jgi:hypothetical protein
LRWTPAGTKCYVRLVQKSPVLLTQQEVLLNCNELQHKLAG